MSYLAFPLHFVQGLCSSVSLLNLYRVTASPHSKAQFIQRGAFGVCGSSFLLQEKLEVEQTRGESTEQHWANKAPNWVISELKCGISNIGNIFILEISKITELSYFLCIRYSIFKRKSFINQCLLACCKCSQCLFC